MSAPDAGVGAGQPTAWFERAAVPGLPDTAASAPSVRSRDEELAAIALRAEQIYPRHFALASRVLTVASRPSIAAYRSAAATRLVAA